MGHKARWFALIPILIAGVLLTVAYPSAGASGPIPLIYCADGGPDDILTVIYLLSNPAIDLKGIILSNGEVHPDEAAPRWLAGMESLGRGDIPVAAGYNGALDPNPHTFPTPWRTAADSLFGMSVPHPQGRVCPENAWTLIGRLTEENPGAVVLVTGPHTDLAMALRLDPALAGRIRLIVTMAGAIQVPGNIHSDWPSETNTVSEWNVWVDALAAAEVFASGIPLRIVPLDATDDVPIDRGFVKRMYDTGKPGPQAASMLYAGMMDGFGKEKLYVWDLLAGVAISHPEYFEWVNTAITVVTEPGPDHGRTVASPNVSANTRFAAGANAETVLGHVLNTMGRP